MLDAVKAGATLFNNTYVQKVETVREPKLLYRCHTEETIFEAPLLIAADEPQKPRKRCYREKETGTRLGKRVCVTVYE